MTFRRRVVATSLCLATLGMVATANAVIVCYDYALHRAAGHAGIPGCDINPPGVSAYLSADQLKVRLKILGYELVSGADAAAFGGKMFNTAGFAEGYLKPGDVVFMRNDHVGFVNHIAGGVPIMDHYIQLPTDIGTAFPLDNLPRSRIAMLTDGRTAHAGLWINDPVQEFLHRRTFAQGGGVEVWRRTGPAHANAEKLVCAGLTPTDVALRLKTAGATCEVTYKIGQPGQVPRATCRSTLDGPPAPNSAQLRVAPDGSGPGATAEAFWDGFQTSKWGWTVRIYYATFQGRGDTTCKGTDGRCTLQIRERPKGTGPAAGREYVGADIGWEVGNGPGNPGFSLSIEQGIDYRK